MPRLVALAEQLLAPVPGGTGRYTRELLRAMAATAPPEWELSTVVSRSRGAGRATVPGVRGPRVLRWPGRALTAAWERGVPLWPGGDSVHAMTPFAPPARRGGKLVVTVHDAVPWTHPATLTPRGVAWHRRAIERAARDADALVVPSAAVAAELARRVEIAAPVHVVSEGVTPSVVADPGAEQRQRVRTRLGLPARYVLAVGTVEPRKGYEDLVRAVASLDVPLLIVGRRGWGGVDPVALARRHGLPSDRVRLLDSSGDAELAVVLRGASALAVPSLDEGFGLPLVEAMAAGVPVVHSDAPALVEVAGGAGVPVERGDATALAGALRGVLEDPARHAALVEAGRDRAERFTWERAAREVWRVHLGRDFRRVR